MNGLNTDCSILIEFFGKLNQRKGLQWRIATFVMDLIGENLVSRPEADYKIQFKLSRKTQGGTVVGNVGINDSCTNTGKITPSAQDQTLFQ
ncbi:MAG: hypothetical protein H0A75_00205 [Candidatus Methanofishera endochildressiae]|uniref:Uncharacterized protein n=1 Tax=Candidatus Methanofishera endochildressiae TaxID=2738884 RepID=A0A7Z0MME0_9GAMM|nr:hypothetical protein [Candidatus Methanofishera endochildressiae]